MAICGQSNPISSLLVHLPLFCLSTKITCEKGNSLYSTVKAEDKWALKVSKHSFEIKGGECL